MVGMDLGLLHDSLGRLTERFFKHSHSNTYVQRIERVKIFSRKSVFCFMSTEK